MAINFPNDPATNPGDGGTWVDGDGNTWTVEIVSGEAIWTMTEAADTGGGGAVTSVNSQTGDVSLGIQDMNDYAPAIPEPNTWEYVRKNKVEPLAAGEAVITGPKLEIWFADVNDKNISSTLSGITPPFNFYLSTDGTNYTEYTCDTKTDNGPNTRLTGLTPEISGIAIDETFFFALLPPGDPLPLAEGDILQWNNSTSKFQPAQITEGSPLDGLLSVDGDAVKYGTAPTLGVDATDVVIPTMGQVRAAIASNGGTSVSLNDLTDVSYTSGSLEPTGLDQIKFSSADVPVGTTSQVWVNPNYGTAFGSYTANRAEWCLFYAHATKGFSAKTPGSSGIFWIEGNDENTNNQPELRLSSGNGVANSPTGNYIGFKMPAGVSSNVTWTLPAVDGAASSVLTSDGAGNLTFEPLPEVTIPTTTYVIGYESTTSYKFTGPGLDGTELNPTLYFIRGQKYTFSNTLGAHPFQLQLVSGTGASPYTDGVTGTQPIDLGSFTWEVPMDAPSTIYYQCTVHASMAGEIKVLDGTGSGGGSGAAVLTYAWSTENGLDGDAFNAGEWAYTAAALRIANIDSLGQDFRAAIEASDEDPQFWISDDGSTWTAVAQGSAGIGLDNPDWTFSNYATTGEFDPSTFSGTIYITLKDPNLGYIKRIDEAEDFDYKYAIPKTYKRSILTTTVDSAGDYYVNSTTKNFFISRTNDDGVDESADFDLYFTVGGKIYWKPESDGTWYSTEITAVGSTAARYSFTVADTPLPYSPAPLLFAYSDPNQTAPLPLQEGDVLRYDATEELWRPNQLATVAATGDYNDLINTPSAADAPVTSVNTETGDVSLGIQDMDDYELKQGEGNYVLTNKVSGAGAVNSAGEWAVFSAGTYLYWWENETVLVDNLSAGDVISLSVPGMTEPHVTTISQIGSNGTAAAVLLTVTAPSEILDAPLGTALTILSNNLPGAPFPLEEGDILQWNGTDSKFQPTQLDYSQINNTPAVKTRITPSVTTAALAVDATETGEITGTGATGFLLSCQTDVAAWVRIYCDSTSMSGDALRDIDTDPSPGAGVLFEALYSTFTEKPITPGTTYFNLAGEDKLYYRITNKSAIADTPITVTFKLLPME